MSNLKKEEHYLTKVINEAKEDPSLEETLYGALIHLYHDKKGVTSEKVEELLYETSDTINKYAPLNNLVYGFTKLLIVALPFIILQLLGNYNQNSQSEFIKYPLNPIIFCICWLPAFIYLAAFSGLDLKTKVKVRKEVRKAVTRICGSIYAIILLFGVIYWVEKIFL